jgi:hypothetical protein
MLNRIGAIAGLIGVAGNVIGVAVLRSVPSAYRPDALRAWAIEVAQAPVAASASAVGFTLGLIALAGWALILGRRIATPVALTGAALCATGAILNAGGTLAPLVVAQLLTPACEAGGDCTAAVALLGSSLALDALFNLLLGVGLVCIGAAMRPDATGPWLKWLTTVAGVMSLPVSLQVFSTTAADLLAIAGPVWLLAVSISSIWLWRQRP